MQEKGTQFEGFGICHRPFNFITKSLLPRSTRSVTMASSGSDAEIPAFFKQSEEQAVNGVSNATSSVHQEIRIRKPKKVVSFMLDTAAEDQEKAKRKGKSKASENRMVPRHWNADPNINENSDAFIRSKKEAMTRDVSFETGQRL